MPLRDRRAIGAAVDHIEVVMSPFDARRVSALLAKASAEIAHLERVAEAAKKARIVLQHRLELARDIANGRPVSLYEASSTPGALTSVTSHVGTWEEQLQAVDLDIARHVAALHLARARAALLNWLVGLAAIERNAQPLIRAESEALPTATYDARARARYEQAKRSADKARESLEKQHGRLSPVVAAWRAARESFVGSLSLEAVTIDTALEGVLVGLTQQAARAAEHGGA